MSNQTAAAAAVFVLLLAITAPVWPLPKSAQIKWYSQKVSFRFTISAKRLFFSRRRWIISAMPTVMSSNNDTSSPPNTSSQIRARFFSTVETKATSSILPTTPGLCGRRRPSLALWLSSWNIDTMASRCRMERIPTRSTQTNSLWFFKTLKKYFSSRISPN